MNAGWQRKEGLSGSPTWPTFIKMMTKMRTDVKKGSGIFFGTFAPFTAPVDNYE